jgi:hypothetical protein
MQFTHSRRQLKYQFGTGALEESWFVFFLQSVLPGTLAIVNCETSWLGIII